MHRIIGVFLLALMLALMLAGCGHGERSPRPEFPGSPMTRMEV